MKAKYAKMSTPSAPALNAWMEVNPRDMSHEANPGQQIIDEGLFANSKAQMRTNVQAALKDAGDMMQTKLADAGARGVTIDAQDHVLNALSGPASQLDLRRKRHFRTSF